MKRKIYKVQSCFGQSATRYSFNAAMNIEAKKMVREYAESNGIRGTWTLESSGRETAPNAPYLTIHGWRVWRHDVTGASIRIVCNLIQSGN